MIAARVRVSREPARLQRSSRFTFGKKKDCRCARTKTQAHIALVGGRRRPAGGCPPPEHHDHFYIDRADPERARGCHLGLPDGRLPEDWACPHITPRLPRMSEATRILTRSCAQPSAPDTTMHGDGAFATVASNLD